MTKKTIEVNQKFIIDLAKSHDKLKKQVAHLEDHIENDLAPDAPVATGHFFNVVFLNNIPQQNRKVYQKQFELELESLFKEYGILYFEGIFNKRMQAIDITNKKFERLTAISLVEKRKDGHYWLFRCDCGTEKIIQKSGVTTGDTQSCGCLQREKVAVLGKITTHGMYRTRFHTIWMGLLQRCTNQNYRYYKDYGGRGITVSERWKKFENFAADMGIHVKRDNRRSIAYSEELIFPISATLQSTDRHHGIMGQEYCHFQRDS